MQIDFIVIGLWVLVLVSGAVAVLKGDTPLRLAGAWMVFWAVAAQFFPRIPAVFLVGDFLYALGFLYLAIRYASWWVGFALLAQALQFTVQSVILVTDNRPDYLYWAANNVIAMAIAWSILIGACLVWRRRRLASSRSALPTGA